MDNEKKLYSLDDAELDTVSGGLDLNPEIKSVNDEIHVNLFGNEADSSVVLQKSRLQSLAKLFWRH